MQRADTARVVVLGAGLALLAAGCGTAQAQGNGGTPSPAAVQAALVARVDRYFAQAGANGTYQITTKQLYQDLQRDPQNYFVMDVRLPQNKDNYGVIAYGYDGYHIPGAVSIPYPDVAKDLSRIPRNKTVVTVCYTGQWANQTAAILRLLGYKAYALHLSMSDWNQRTDVLPPRAKVPDYPLVSGTQPGTFPSTP
ncbi:putative sulfurtransferase [Candidatus Hydrogenisulfobacillus filiaventi]|uniref:Putative sulfurtransferase n=1 Tax=Candidatus Hydrogenisulfobacillus filiaventi TaxID=2707344 RepID=A0A6F8ZF58_9FIRM|nr:rhodanese-like domain-containing protein [Bacillota bacterium]CAB1128300.1 putative sulfurtransferase [Candidatus Hydrogenisulfobacillus filiaventi]